MNGDTLWTRNYGTANDEIAYFINETADGGYFVGGSSNNSTYIIKTDSLGMGGCNLLSFPYTVVTVSPVFSANAPVSFENSSWTIDSLPFTVNAGATSLTLCSTVDVKNVAEINSLLIYPNPVTNMLCIQSILNGDEIEINIYDGVGRLINVSSESKSNIITFNTSIFLRACIL